MPRTRRQFTGPEKIAILREHLLEGQPVSEVCQKHDLQPNMFYNWQKRLFEEGASLFENKPTGRKAREAPEKRIEALEAKLQEKNEVLAEVMGEYVQVKKKFGQI